MTHKRTGDLISLEMTVDDYESLMPFLGFASGAALAKEDRQRFWSILDFTNRLNATNPNFRQYEIPEEFRPCKGPIQ